MFSGSRRRRFVRDLPSRNDANDPTRENERPLQCHVIGNNVGLIAEIYPLRVCQITLLPFIDGKCRQTGRVPSPSRHETNPGRRDVYGKEGERAKWGKKRMRERSGILRNRFERRSTSSCLLEGDLDRRNTAQGSLNLSTSISLG